MIAALSSWRAPRRGSVRALLLVLLPVMAVLAGCDSGPEPELAINEATGEGRAALKTERGTMIGASGPNVPLDLPEGFSLYPGAQVLNNIVTDNAGQKSAHVVMESSASPEEMVAYYSEQMRGAGFEEAIRQATAEGQFISGEGPEGRVFSFTASVAPPEDEREAFQGAAITETDGPKERARKFELTGRAKPSQPSAAAGATTGQLVIGYKHGAL